MEDVAELKEKLEKLEQEVHGGVDFQVKSGHRLKFHGVAQCPVCETSLQLAWLIQDSWPYPHADFNLKCVKCGWTGTFGVASNPLFGMEVIIWDSQPDVVYSQAKKVEPPVCPFHNRKMEITKIWGDKVMKNPDFIRVQWKCPEWFLTEHKTVPRTSPPLLQTSGKNEKKMLNRLKKLGYM